MSRLANKAGGMSVNFQQRTLGDAAPFVAERFIERLESGTLVFSLRFGYPNGYASHPRAGSASYALSLSQAVYELCSADEYYAAMRKVSAEASVDDHYKRKARKKYYRELYPKQYRRGPATRKQPSRSCNRDGAVGRATQATQARLPIAIPTIELARSRMLIMRPAWESFPGEFSYRSLAYGCNGRSRPKRFQSDLDWLVEYGFLIRFGEIYRATEKRDPSEGYGANGLYFAADPDAKLDRPRGGIVATLEIAR